ncbi:hypothetical protein [Caproiciproducens sp. CPB-2]|uniref:hypothetical protein n=1 Tax=Caproiciproducens sp. CPB-2 TaxID=3030017 RepID=UPI0023DB56BF|nr:hypothetical protein [Caproiciproducens sp. CPB-2]MDF1496327.1 hypothetical protein [Caproiciproducens sp. CPB-2]
MKIEITEEDRQFLANALNYITLSLDGYDLDNSNLPNGDKLKILGKCYSLLQMFFHATDKEKVNK